MNKARRTKLNEIWETLSGALDDLRLIGEEEQECYDNLPEGLQESDRGYQMQDNAEMIDTLVTDLESVCDDLSNFLDDC